jgi:mono/diheme cytochrome c family protein
MNGIRTLLAAAVAAAATAGVIAADAPLTAQQQHGRKVFDIKCLPCHGPGMWGTNALARRMPLDKAELEKRTDLNAVMVKTLMRVGIGSMPPIRKTEVDDADADAIAAYLTRNSPR